jgi:peptidylprolyl isomerase
MAAGQGKDNTPAGDPDRAKMMRVLIPALAVGAIVILVAVITGMSDGSSKKMSDGSNGDVDDPDLKEAAPGVKYRDLKEGSGAACPPGAKVKVGYMGWLTDGTVFDSNKSMEFGLDGVIDGWKEGIPGMKPGGIRKLVIAPEKAYGIRGSPPKIPGGSTLVFEVELLTVIPAQRSRRTPAPTDLTKLFDGTAPGAEDPNLIAIGDKGLKYRDLKEGDGPVVPPGTGSTVTVDYIGWRTDGKMFDSSWKGGRSFSTQLGGVVRGWQQGIPGMKVGGIRKLVIPPDLAYGAKGAGEDIPPNATLVFEVELLDVK